MTVKVAYTVLIRLVSTMYMNAKALATNDTDYSCHVYKLHNLFIQSHGVHIMLHHTTSV